MAVEERAEPADRDAVARREVVQGPGQRHLPEAVVVPERLAVGGHHDDRGPVDRLGPGRDRVGQAAAVVEERAVERDRV